MLYGTAFTSHQITPLGKDSTCTPDDDNQEDYIDQDDHDDYNDHDDYKHYQRHNGPRVLSL